MQLRTATYTSVQNRRLSGYQLLNVSDGIDDKVSISLARWSPSHDGLFDGAADARSFNFFNCGDGQYGFSRTCFGGPEYSGRSGLQVFTRILILTEEQFAAFGYDASDVVQRMASSGAFHFCNSKDGQFDIRLLQPSRLRRPQNPDDLIAHHGFRAVQMLGRDQQLAVIGIDNTMSFLRAIFKGIDQHTRKEMSFCTGLKPTRTRPFRIQFFNKLTESLKNDLSREKIPVLDCSTY